MKRFISALPEGMHGVAAITGVPFDGTSTYRPGARFAPDAIREASFSLETFSPFLDKDLIGFDYADWGDLDAAPGNVLRIIEETEKRVAEIVESKSSPVILGGEHTITAGAVKALLKKYPDLAVLQFDAHADFRDDYMDEKYNHATVMKRISELMDPHEIYRLGIRSGTREELIDAGISLPIDIGDYIGKNASNVIINIPEAQPLYVTIDMDVFDPSLVPGVGNPEPHGITWREFVQLTRALAFRNVVGFDVVELSPQYDSTGVSAIVAASVVREMLLSLYK